ncbi:MAG: site-2 protease family protein [Candidatus Altiarchaeota archaeon]
MRWSYRLFRVNGISIELHLTFILFFMLIFMSSGWPGFMFFILIFATVLAHELIHSLTAVLHGIRVPKIMLLPIGGLASIEMPDDPILELKVSIVGPLFNFMLAGVGLLMFSALNSSFVGYGTVVDWVFSGSFGMDSVSAVLSVIVSINLTLGLFNMLPAFPMDGGRVFRSILAFWMDYVKATKIATLVGQLIFSALAFIGILTFNIWWVIIGMFLSYAGGSELKYVNLKALVSGVKLRDIAVPGLIYVNSSLSWGDFLSTVYRRGRSLYLTVDSSGVVKGVLDLAELRSADLNRPVGDAPATEYSVLDGGLMVSGILKVLLSQKLVLVSDGGRLLGYVTPETLADSAAYMSLSRTLR